MEKILRRIFITILVLTVMITPLTGCKEENEDEYEETTVVVDKKGRITQNIVESFDKDYYSLDELTSSFDEGISSYNAASGTKSIELKSISEENGRIYATVKYDDYDAFTSLQGQTMFYGTVKDAYAKGFLMDVTLKGIADGDKIGKVQIMGMADKHIIIITGPLRLETYADVAYVSANVDVLNNRSIRVTSETGTGLAYVLLNK